MIKPNHKKICQLADGELENLINTTGRELTDDQKTFLWDLYYDYFEAVEAAKFQSAG